MRRSVLMLGLFLAVASLSLTAQTAAPWKTQVAASMPMLGHRNWILVVDSAYPLQTSPGIETIETNADQLDVVKYVLGTVNNSIHVRPLITMDSELRFVPDQDAPGVSAYRTAIATLFQAYKIDTLPHSNILARMDETSKEYHILVLKTTMTIPYTSVFIRLDCKYWSDEAEKRLRENMH